MKERGEEKKRNGRWCMTAEMWDVRMRGKGENDGKEEWHEGEGKMEKGGKGEWKGD